MPIDFSQVKTITIPEGSVTKITDSTGNTLWQGVGWHTIWEGNKTCSIKTNGSNTPTISGDDNNFSQTVVGTGYKPKIRITFSYSITNISNSFEKKFYINDSSYSTFPSSPLTIDAVATDDWYDYVFICGPMVRPKNTTAYARSLLRADKDTENNRLIFSLVSSYSNIEDGYGAYFTITFTVTKIEQYY